MDSYIAPRSVVRLEEEVAELEKAHLIPQEVVEEEEEKEEVVETPPSSPEEETWKKRHGDLRRLSQKQAEDLKKANDRLAALEKDKHSAGLPSAEEAEEWAKTNPQAAAIIRALVGEKVAQSAPSNEDINSLRWELDRAKEESKIKKIHPDFEELTTSDEFHTWAENQPASVQSLIYTTKSDDLIWALNLYKKEMNVQESPNKAAARSVVSKSSNAPTDTNGKKKFSESQVQAMSLPDYEKNEDAIRESMKSGNFVYDLSGGAR
jgi:hypothetical protein